MLNLYYKIWAGAINGQRSSEAIVRQAFNWQTTSLLVVSLPMAINLASIDMILERYIFHTKLLYKLNINIFPGNRIDYALTFYILFGLVPLTLNYFLIFYKDKYKKILDKHKKPNVKIFLIYYMISFLLFMGLGAFAQFYLKV